MKSWFVSVLVLLFGLAAAAAAAAESSQSQTQAPRKRLPVVEVGDAPFLGPESAPIAIVEFSDFQCPYCARGSRTLRRLLKLYPTQIRWVFKHFPLRIHPDAPLAHEAAAAAREQGKFWEMHDLLFANQKRLKRQDLIRYASRLGLELSTFTKALDARQFRAQVLRDIIQGRRLRVGGTPTYFINGRKLFGAHPIPKFRQLIKPELAEKKIPSGRPRAE